MRNLVVYYSRSGNTETVAQEIAKAANGEIIEIELVKDIGLVWASIAALLGLKGKIKTINFNLKDYDNIFIGSPIWAGKNSTPINTFLSEVDFTGKNVFIFITRADSKAPYSVYEFINSNVKRKGGKVIDSFFMQTNIKNPMTPNQAIGPVSEWISKNKSFL